jgi:hypothetical protein
VAAKRAMIVGINDYMDESIAPLGGARNDASELKELLTEHGDFEVSDDAFLLDDEATADHLRTGVSDLLWKTDPCDLALFYFSGHGFLDSYGSGFIAPHDMIRDRPLVRGIKMQDLKRLALQSRNKTCVILILDCCYSGIASQGEKNSPQAEDTARKCFSDLDDQDDGQIAGTGTIVISSSAGDQKSRELSECRHKLGRTGPHTHGALTFHLLEGLAGAAGSDEQGQVSLNDLVTFFDEQFRDDPKQSPQWFGAGLRNLAEICIARASMLGEIERKLGTVRNHMEMKEYQYLLLAAAGLADVLADSPNYEPALQVREQLNDRLNVCRAKILDWIVGNKMSMRQQLQHPRNVKTLHNIEELVKNLTFERISMQTDSMQGLLITLFETVDAGQTAHDFLPFLMKGYEGKSARVPNKQGVDLAGK